jgi:peptide/nickel transport system substrate-binding protein
LAGRFRPAAPSGRVYVAFGLAAVFGLAVFAIWWATAERSAPVPSADQPAVPIAPESAPPVISETLPRGGTLTGSTGDLAGAARWLTQAPLVRINRSSDALEPWLAESWTAAPGNLSYTLKLRPGLTWSDGTPLDIEDVVSTVAAASAAPGDSADRPGAFSVRAVDPATLELAFAQPFAPGLRVLDARPILPRHAPADRVGLGPFVAAGKGRFTRNPHYWRKAPDGEPLPYVDEIVLAAAAPGRDFADVPIRPEDYEALRKLELDRTVKLFHLGPGLDADALSFSDVDPAKSDKPWLHGDVFRRAISTAVDRRQYCQQVFFGACDPIAGPVSPANAAWFDPDLPLGPGNPQVARTMLADLGLRDRTGDLILDDAMRRPVRFSMLIRRDVPSAARAATFLADTLREVGVQLEVTPVDAVTLAARRAKGSYEAIYDRVETADTDPAMNLGFWLTPEPGAAWQRQINQLMLKNASSFDRLDRLESFAEVQRIYNQYSPAVFFGVPHVRVFTSARVLNATPSPLVPHLLWNAESLAVLK